MTRRVQTSINKHHSGEVRGKDGGGERETKGKGRSARAQLGKKFGAEKRKAATKYPHPKRIPQRRGERTQNVLTVCNLRSRQRRRKKWGNYQVARVFRGVRQKTLNTGKRKKSSTRLHKANLTTEYVRRSGEGLENQQKRGEKQKRKGSQDSSTPIPTGAEGGCNPPPLGRGGGEKGTRKKEKGRIKR